MGLLEVDEEQYRLIEQAAAAKKVSVNEFINACIDREIKALEASQGDKDLWGKILSFPTGER